MVMFSALSHRACDRRVSPVSVCVEYCIHVHALVLSHQSLIAEENTNGAETDLKGENIVLESVALVQQDNWAHP